MINNSTDEAIAGHSPIEIIGYFVELVGDLGIETLDRRPGENGLHLLAIALISLRSILATFTGSTAQIQELRRAS